MSLTLYQRYEASAQNEIYRGQIMGALLKHAKWVVRTMPDTTPLYNEQIAFARGIIANASNYAFPVGFAVITEPVYDELSDITSLTDEAIGDTVAEIFTLFVAPSS